MVRKTSRRFTNYTAQNNEQQSNEWQQPQHSNSYENKENDSLIADMAQGFIQAQAQAQAVISDKAMNFNNMEIALLLQKVNDQLEEIKRSTPHSPQTGAQSNTSSTGQDSSSQNIAGGTAQDNSQQQVAGGSATELQGLLTAALQGQKNNENSANKSKGVNSPPNMITAQTVSQVLAQAQYELANELETSLKKLKQVISKSEKLASDISNLLGEENMKKS